MTRSSTEERFIFALTPGQLNRSELINYNSKTGIAHWNAATKPLRKESQLYDCTPDGFHQFMKSIKVRAETYGWSKPNTGFLWFPPDPEKSSREANILDDYGTFSMDVIKEYEKGYVGKQSRKAQDNRMLFECIYHSLSVQGMAKVNIHDDQYMIGKPKVPSALCFLKVLIRESYLDSNATTSMIRTRLATLDELLAEVGNDVDKFHDEVKVLLSSLTARGETTQDLQTNLFKAYGTCKDRQFVRYIADLQTKYEDGENITANHLMERAQHKFKILKTRKEWEAPSPEDEKLLALESTVTKLKSELKDQKKKSPKKSNDGGAKFGKYKGKGGDGKGLDKGRPKWFRQKPTQEEMHKSKFWNKAEWHYCSPETGGKCSGKWRIHKPKDCKSRPQTPSGEDKTNKSGNSDKDKFLAQQAVVDNESDSAYQSE